MFRIEPAPPGTEQFYGPGWLQGVNGVTRMRWLVVELLDGDYIGAIRDIPDAVHIEAGSGKGEATSGFSLSLEDARSLGVALLELTG